MPLGSGRRIVLCGLALERWGQTLKSKKERKARFTLNPTAPIIVAETQLLGRPPFLPFMWHADPCFLGCSSSVARALTIRQALFQVLASISCFCCRAFVLFVPLAIPDAVLIISGFVLNINVFFTGPEALRGQELSLCLPQRCSINIVKWMCNVIGWIVWFHFPHNYEGHYSHVRDDKTEA